MSNTVCQYFIQGKCRFGARCRNLHPGTQANTFNSLTGRRPALASNQYSQQGQQTKTLSAGYNTSYNRFSMLSDDGGLGQQLDGHSFNDNRAGTIFNQATRSSSSFNPFLAPQEQEDMSEDDIPHVENIRSILHADVLEWTLWPLSSYSPIGGISLFPELEDVSPEEIRWEYCLAHNSNNLQEYSNKLNHLMLNRKVLISQLVVIKREDLDNRLMSVKDKLLTMNPVMPEPHSNKLFEAVIPAKPSQASSSTNVSTATILTPAIKPSSQVTTSYGLKKASTVAALSKEDIEAFKADSFVLGKVPTRAPPAEFC